MQTIKLRKETTEDDTFLRQIYAYSRMEEMACIPWSAEQKSAFLKMQYDFQHKHYHNVYPNADFSIVLVSNNPAGRLYIQRGTQAFHLIDITLLPDYRGKGIGQYLLKTLLTEAQSVGKPIHLQVQSNNRAMRFYQRLGFKFSKGNEVYVLMEWMPKIN